MADYIEREAFIEQKREQYCKDCARRKGTRNGKYKTLYEIGEAPCRACETDDMLNDVEDFPAADVAPVRHGRWLDISDIDHDSKLCSSCGIGVTGLLAKRCNYCPNCGAKMDGGDTNG